MYNFIICNADDISGYDLTKKYQNLIENSIFCILIPLQMGLMMSWHVMMCHQTLFTLFWSKLFIWLIKILKNHQKSFNLMVTFWWHFFMTKLCLLSWYFMTWHEFSWYLTNLSREVLGHHPPTADGSRRGRGPGHRLGPTVLPVWRGSN